MTAALIYIALGAVLAVAVPRLARRAAARWPVLGRAARVVRRSGGLARGLSARGPRRDREEDAHPVLVLVRQISAAAAGAGVAVLVLVGLVAPSGLPVWGPVAAVVLLAALVTWTLASHAREMRRIRDRAERTPRRAPGGGV